MNDYILFMHDDAAHVDEAAWEPYFAKLRARGGFDGGSAIGEGECLRKNQTPPPTSRHLTGYIRIRAENLSEARQLVDGNPVYEAGGTVELRLLPRS